MQSRQYCPIAQSQQDTRRRSVRLFAFTSLFLLPQFATTEKSVQPYARNFFEPVTFVALIVQTALPLHERFAYFRNLGPRLFGAFVQVRAALATSRIFSTALAL